MRTAHDGVVMRTAHMGHMPSWCASPSQMMSRARRTVTISVGSPTGNAARLEFWSSRVPDLSQTIAAPRCALLWRAAMYIVVASFLFATMNGLAKYVLITPAGAEIGALQVTFAAIFQGRFFCCRFCFKRAQHRMCCCRC